MTWQHKIVRMDNPEPLSRVLTEMGADGWELVLNLPDPTQYATLVFKRPAKGTSNETEAKAEEFYVSEVQPNPIQETGFNEGQGVRRRGRPKGSKNKPKVPQAMQEPLTEQIAK